MKTYLQKSIFVLAVAIMFATSSAAWARTGGGSGRGGMMGGGRGGHHGGNHGGSHNGGWHLFGGHR